MFTISKLLKRKRGKKINQIKWNTFFWTKGILQSVKGLISISINRVDGQEREFFEPNQKKRWTAKRHLLLEM